MNSNPVLMLAHNALRLTQHAVWSVLYQDVPVQLLVVDNDSTDGTWAWLNGLGMPNVHTVSFRPQKGVSAGWNWGLAELFEYGGAEHVLVLNNDVELPPDFYRRLLARLPECPWLVTGVSVDDRGVVRRAAGAAGDAPRGSQDAPGATTELP